MSFSKDETFIDAFQLTIILQLNPVKYGYMAAGQCYQVVVLQCAEGAAYYVADGSEAGGYFVVGERQDEGVFTVGFFQD